eukprot:2316384-Rhodomonas_salina.1
MFESGPKGRALGGTCAGVIWGAMARRVRQQVCASAALKGAARCPVRVAESARLSCRLACNNAPPRQHLAHTISLNPQRSCDTDAFPRLCLSGEVCQRLCLGAFPFLRGDSTPEGG